MNNEIKELLRANIEHMMFPFDNQKEYTSYKFLVNNKKDINANKIRDDLSYSDPLRIVEFKDKVYPIVDHTIYDKFLRSELSGVFADKALHKAIKGKTNSIKKKEIKLIIKHIKMIKNAKWIKSVKGDKEVIVTKIKI